MQFEEIEPVRTFFQERVNIFLMEHIKYNPGAEFEIIPSNIT